ncbi:RecBCD enzyme subunit RecB [Mycobacterium marinum]|nr:RecBCD enzyme subunit RecB [Mycobacterium marinum]
MTLDSLIYDLLRTLLTAGFIRWPGGHTSLEVHDTWKVLVEHDWTRSVAQLYLFKDEVAVRTTYDESNTRPKPEAFAEAVSAGLCTHADVRRILDFALKSVEISTFLQGQLAQTIRAFIVDEVFDANELDIRVIELALAAGVEVVLIGDPWQALYGFRGARPDLIPGLLTTANMRTLRLTKSFRWRTAEQAMLANDLRLGRPVTLESVSEDDLLTAEVDVVLASLWEGLWSAGSRVLPTAWGSAKGNIVEAATTLLLNQSISVLFGLRATYLGDALSTLGMVESQLQELEYGLSGVLELVEAADTRDEWRAAYGELASVVGSVTAVSFPRVHANYVARLKLLQPRLRAAGQVVPGMTIHQAKGREWDVVACRLTDVEGAHLARGLTSASEKHRQLYVSCTRARFATRRLIVD